MQGGARGAAYATGGSVTHASRTERHDGTRKEVREQTLPRAPVATYLLARACACVWRSSDVGPRACSACRSVGPGVGAAPAGRTTRAAHENANLGAAQPPEVERPPGERADVMASCVGDAELARVIPYRPGSARQTAMAGATASSNRSGSLAVHAGSRFSYHARVEDVARGPDVIVGECRASVFNHRGPSCASEGESIAFARIALACFFLFILAALLRPALRSAHRLPGAEGLLVPVKTF